jgi:hypothetical protein
MFYSAIVLDPLAFARFPLGYYYQLLFKLSNPGCLKRILVQYQFITFYKLGEASLSCDRQLSEGAAH